jgi:aryl-alcohol dehydrogenase-like predicted oxidoreductase
MAYSPLSRGLLTGKMRKYEDLEEGDARKDLPRFSKENFHKNLEIVDKLDELAKAKGVSSAELVLAWIMAQGKDIFPIPGYVIPTILSDRFELLIAHRSEPQKSSTSNRIFVH